VTGLTSQHTHKTKIPTSSKIYHSWNKIKENFKYIVGIMEPYSRSIHQTCWWCKDYKSPPFQKPLQGSETPKQLNFIKCLLQNLMGQQSLLQLHHIYTCKSNILTITSKNKEAQILYNQFYLVEPWYYNE
jgi:hypothetical protein